MMSMQKQKLEGYDHTSRYNDLLLDFGINYFKWNKQPSKYQDASTRIITLKIVRF